MKNKIILLTAGSVPLIVASAAAIAGAPVGQYTVNAGTITDALTGTTAPTVNLVSGNGFLQQKVTTAAGSFYRTIILDNNATGTDAAGVAALNFRNETWVGSTSNSGALGSDGFVRLAAPTGVATAGSGSTSSVTMAGVTLPYNSTEAILARGALATTGTVAAIEAGTADPTGIKIIQAHDYSVDTTATGGVITETNTGSGAALTSMYQNFEFLSNGTAATQAARSNFMRMDEVRYAGTDPGQMTARRVSGDFSTQTGVFTLPDGSTVAISAGDDIGVSLFDNKTLGGGTFGYPTTGTAIGASGSLNGVTEAMTFHNYTSGDMGEWVNDSYQQAATNGGVINGGLTGYPQTLFTPVMQQTGTLTTAMTWTSAYWDTDFGTAPKVWTRNGTNTALLGGITATLPAFTYP